MAQSTSKDWKYVVMLAVTIAGVFSPMWLTRFQSPDKQIIVREISQSAMQSVTKDAVPGLQLLIDGTALSDPYFSVLQITNDGDKPITVRDFEAPLEILLGENRNVERVKVSERSPHDVVAEVTWEKNTIRLSPTLLNPKDQFTLTIISTGGAPTFVTRARIAGVSSVPVMKTENEKPKLVPSAFLLVGAFLCSVTGITAYGRWPLFAPKGTFIRLRARTVLAISLVLQCAVTGLIMTLLIINGVESYWIMLMTIFGVEALSIPFARLLEAPPTDDGERY